MDPRAAALLAPLGLPTDLDVAIDGADPVLPSPIAVGEGAAVAIAATAAAVAALWRDRTGEAPSVRVGVGEAARSLLSFLYVRAEPPIPTDRGPGVAVTDLFETADGRWIHLHGGFPHLADGTLALLGGVAPEPSAVAEAVRRWDAAALEDALAAAGLCGAIARRPEEWDAHPQAAAMARRGVVDVERVGDGPAVAVGDGVRPLGGVRVLDLTRVLAGPTVGRTLAEHGAEVLLVNGPGRPNVELFVADTSHGKRSAFVDLATAEGRERIAALLAEADVVVDGYRPGALEARGIEIPPGRVHVRVSCYGDDGPWRARRGWEQMAEAATGMAVVQGGAGRPRCVPAAPCDYTTGTLGALGALAALRRRASEGGSYVVRTSLVQTGRWLRDLRPPLDPAAATGVPDAASALVAEDGPWGRLHHLPPVAEMTLVPPRWSMPSRPVGTDPPRWG